MCADRLMTIMLFAQGSEVVFYAPVNYAMRLSGPVTTLAARPPFRHGVRPVLICQAEFTGRC
jgi:hypothetical protein